MLKVCSIFIVTLTIFLFPKTSYAAIDFSIANPQTDGNTTTIDITISGLTANSCSDGKCYLQAAYTKQDSTRYFGFTKSGSGNWYQYQGEPGQDNIKSNFFSFEPQSGDWTGTLTLKVDLEDSDYKGPGAYTIKVWRYSGNSDNSSGSSDNTLSVDLTVPTTSVSPSPSPTPESNSSSSTTSTSKPPTPKATPKISTKKSPSPTPKVLSAQTGSPSAQTTQQQGIENSISKVDPNQFNPPSSTSSTQTTTNKFAALLVGSGAVMIGISTAGFLWYKRQEGHSSIQKERQRFEEE